MAINLRDRGIGVILLDIEGTTTPMAFVYDVLFPYARARLGAYVRAHAAEDELRDVLATLRVEWQEDARKQLEPPPWALADVPAAARYLDWLMEQDRKSPSLKRIQGWIWESAFTSGELQPDLFPDVAPALARWKAAGLEIGIYSSGSVLAQKLIFGNLLSYISAFFDTSAPWSSRRYTGMAPVSLMIGPSAVWKSVDLAMKRMSRSAVAQMTTGSRSEFGWLASSSAAPSAGGAPTRSTR